MRALALLLVSLATAFATPHWRPPLLPSRYMLQPRSQWRDLHQRKMFMILTGYPQGRPGYIIDHIIPLNRGGLDAWWNMQWQTKAEARAKDRVE